MIRSRYIRQVGRNNLIVLDLIRSITLDSVFENNLSILTIVARTNVAWTNVARTDVAWTNVA